MHAFHGDGVGLRGTVDVAVARTQDRAVGDDHRVGRHRLARGFELSAGKCGDEVVDRARSFVLGGLHGLRGRGGRRLCEGRSRDQRGQEQGSGKNESTHGHGPHLGGDGH